MQAPEPRGEKTVIWPAFLAGYVITARPALVGGAEKMIISYEPTEYTGVPQYLHTPTCCFMSPGVHFCRGIPLWQL